jgi:NADH-quinone oxidoreductase subunit D
MRLMAEHTLPHPGQDVFSDTVLTAGGGDQVEIAAPAASYRRVMLTPSTIHTSAHGVQQLILEIHGETVTEVRWRDKCVYTGLDHSTQVDNLPAFFNETAYCLGVETLLDITEAIPQRANVIRVLLMELTRIFSHLVALTTGGRELGKLTARRFGLPETELIVGAFHKITGTRMSHTYIRPGGLAWDVPDEAIGMIHNLLELLRKRLGDMEKQLERGLTRKGRTQGIGYLSPKRCIELGVTGPVLRSAGLPHDLRRTQPYCGYESYEFKVITDTGCDAYTGYLIRVREMKESLKIVEQCLDRLAPGPIRAHDPNVARFTDLALGPDDFGESRKHLARIMGTSAEALTQHFKQVTEGIPASAQIYVAVESPCGELGAHIVSDAGTRPYQVHYRDPSFTNLQAFATIFRGALIGDVIAAVASFGLVASWVGR